MTRYLVDGVHLNVEELAPDAAGRPGHLPTRVDRPPLVLLHGFTGSAETWRPIAPALAARARAIAVDLLGHGCADAPADPAPYRAERQVAQLLALFDRLELDRPHLLGYSMGGRLALQLAATALDRIRSLVLESASPGIADPAERAARVASDEALADFAEREGIEAFVDRWERAPLFASQASLPAETRARVRAGRLRSDARGLAGSLRGFGAGVPDPLWERLPRFDLPTLVVVGALDEKYRQVGGRTAELIPGARFEIVEGAGHTVHLERPDAFVRLVLDFLGD